MNQQKGNPLLCRDPCFQMPTCPNDFDEFSRRTLENDQSLKLFLILFSRAISTICYNHSSFLNPAFFLPVWKKRIPGSGGSYHALTLERHRQSSPTTSCLKHPKGPEPQGKRSTHIASEILMGLFAHGLPGFPKKTAGRTFRRGLGGATGDCAKHLHSVSSVKRH